jgi:hypothetical protein
MTWSCVIGLIGSLFRWLKGIRREPGLRGSIELQDQTCEAENCENLKLALWGIEKKKILP